LHIGNRPARFRTDSGDFMAAGLAQMAVWALDRALAELTLFAAVAFLLGGVDDLAVDLAWCRFRRPAGSLADLPPGAAQRLAVFVPAWDEQAVIGAMLRAALSRYDHPDYRLYVGCYPNDPATIGAVRAVAAGDARVRLVIGARAGPTTKADCLNALWHALEQADAAEGRRTTAVVLHDAEDVVHPAELRVFDHFLRDHAAVQLPVVPLIDPQRALVSGHYADEFSEAHGKAMVVRAGLRAALPLAGVGCAIRCDALARLAAANGTPFDAASLTEDYELYGVQDKTYYVGKIFIPTWQLVLRPTARCGLQPFHIIIAANAVRRRQNWWRAAGPLSGAQTT
jgi:adsorption protein B